MSSIARFSIDEILECTGGSIAWSHSDGSSPERKGPLSTDSRTVGSGDVYLSLKGEKFDGHDFVVDAITAGALAAIVNADAADGLKEKLATAKPSSGVLIAVENTLYAYHKLAGFWRQKIDPFVVAVTGSSGKTTTKEMCAAVFADARRTHKNQKNENNEFGVPKTILSMPDDTEILVVELAMRGLGQIDELAVIAKPDVGIITCAGTAHIELLGSQENIAIAKCEMLKHLAENGTAVIGAPTDLLMTEVMKALPGRLRAFDDEDVQELDVSEAGTTFRVNSLAADFFVSTHGTYHIQDAWCAVVAGIDAGLTPKEIRDGLATYSSVKGRGNVLTTSQGTVVVDESYNANPDSVRCAVDGVVDNRAFPQVKKIVVLGEMAELGPTSETLHRELGSWIKEKPISLLVTVGEKAAAIGEAARGASFEVRQCSDIVDALNAIKPQMTNDACVMVKGSNCARLYDLVDRLVNGG